MNSHSYSDFKLPTTDEEALAILPELGGHGIYGILREFGVPILEACLCVWHMQIDENDEAYAIMDKYDVPRSKQEVESE